MCVLRARRARACACAHAPPDAHPPLGARSLLHQNGLVGSLPASLSTLLHLTALCVRAPLPHEKTHQTQRSSRPYLTPSLRARSDVSENVLTGTLPPGLGALTALTLLCVHAPPRASALLKSAKTRPLSVLTRAHNLLCVPVCACSAAP
jgi:hypothetical protein